MSTNQPKSQQDIIQQFVKAATDFCLLIENQETYNQPQFIKQLTVFLVSLYASGLALLEVAVEDTVTRNYPSLGVSFEIQRALQSKICQYNLYWEVFDPYEKEEPVSFKITGDLTDIYYEIKQGLIAFNSGNSIQATTQWKFSFDHWGAHLVNTLRVLHRLNRRLNDPENS